VYFVVALNSKVAPNIVRPSYRHVTGKDDRRTQNRTSTSTTQKNLDDDLKPFKTPKDTNLSLSYSPKGNVEESMNKLSPIYTALESGAYNKAIKLCLAQPSNVLLAKALLAHAYGKAGQRYKALLVVQEILGQQHCKDYFPELRLELKYSIESLSETTATTTPAPVATAKKAGKKGKKKGGTAPSIGENSQTDATDESWDLIDRLDVPPQLPESWDQVPPPADAPIDETLLSTLSMTMVSVLRLPLTCYQMYCWAASKAENDEFTVRKAYLSGFAVLVAPQYQHIAGAILANMQVLALQLARVQQQAFGISPATAWAAQTALWQLQLESQDPHKMVLLPRLAESLASKAVYQQPFKDPLTATENFLLYIRTLDYQNKWEEKLKALQDKLDEAADQMVPPRQTVLDMKADTLLKLKRFSEAREVIEELLSEYPDDWRFWKIHLECVLGDSDGADVSATEKFVETILEKNRDNKYPLRGPRLMRLDLVEQRNKLENISEDEARQAMLNAIKAYGDEIGGSCTCVYADLAPYLDTVLKGSDIEFGKSLVEWAKEKQVSPFNDDPKTSRAHLRNYLLGMNILHRVVTEHKELLKVALPPWQDLVEVWKVLESTGEKDQAQKESRPADDLILLAVQQLLYDDPDRERLVTAACLLESAIHWSPYNAYLKISAILVYGALNSVSRAWELAKGLQIKHIQHESCVFFLLPLLHAGGLYREMLFICQEILRLQQTAIRDASDFAARAMENGSYSKAEEFINFQKKRMNMSLTTLEAKGYILDSAALYVQDDRQDALGAIQGIVGGESDIERASQMVAEAHNPLGAFSLLKFRGSLEHMSVIYSDNRDFSIFSNEILLRRTFASSEQIVNDCMRRGHHQRLLITAALCLEATKGPKKGKISKNTIEQEKCCKSLLSTIQSAYEISLDQRYGSMLKSMHGMCFAISAFGAGIHPESSPIEDTLESREEKIVSYLLAAEKDLKYVVDIFSFASNQLSVSEVCRVLPDFVIPIFAFFRMCLRAAELYGWGPRKHKSKPCASAVFSLCTTIRLLVQQMKDCISR
jgi:N-terminal acetyltransferase B complex non-catalytic subunit